MSRVTPRVAEAAWEVLTIFCLSQFQFFVVCLWVISGRGREFEEAVLKYESLRGGFLFCRQAVRESKMRGEILP